MNRAETYRYADFTHANYRRLVALAKTKYRFADYQDYAGSDPAVVWRHDVDCSMHAALTLARIEHEENVRATYFLLPGSAFYNLHEPSIKQCVRGIAALGHGFGLHFDAQAYNTENVAALEAALHYEKTMLEAYCKQPIHAFSFHNPTHGAMVFDGEYYAGMRNTYSRSFRDDIEYCSDSNGIWRHASLEDTLTKAPARLQVLTHPEWWTHAAMSPRERIARCIEGRALNVLRHYNDDLKNHGRENIAPIHELMEHIDMLVPRDVALLFQMLWLRGHQSLAFMLLWHAYKASTASSHGTDMLHETALAIAKGDDISLAVLEACVNDVVQSWSGQLRALHA